MNIYQKIVMTIIVLVLLPSVSIGVIAYGEAKKNLNLQASANLELVKQETQIKMTDSREIAEVMHAYAAANIETNISVAREKFAQACGSYAEKDGETLVCEKGLKINDALYNNDLLQNIKSVVKGESGIFVKIDDESAKKISATDVGNIYAYGYMMEPEMYQTTIVNGKSFIKYSKIGGIFATKSCTSIRNKAGETVGTLCVKIDEDKEIANLIQKYENTKFGKNGRIYVVSNLENISAGKFVVHETLKGQDGSNLSYVKEMLTKKDGVIKYSENGKTKIASYGFFEPYNWIIVAEEDDVNSGAVIAGTRNKIILNGLMFLVIAIIAGLLLAKRIVSPIKKITEAFKKISDGDLDSAMPEINTKDEIKDLADTMSMVIGALKYTRGQKK